MLRWILMAVAGSAIASAAALAQTAPQASAGTTAASAPSAPAGGGGASGDRMAPNLGQLMQSNGGSLFRASLLVPHDSNSNSGPAKLAQVSYTAVPEPEAKKIKKHDLVTIIVKEESSFSSQQNTDLERQADLNAQLAQFVSLSQLAKGRLTNEQFLQNGQSTPVGVQATASRDLKGQAEIDRQDSLILRVQAEVVDVRPNGNLVIQARKDIKTDEEEQHIVLSGVCRAEDISPDNSILSTQLADVVMQKNHKGAVKDNGERGWTQRIMDGINPF